MTTPKLDPQAILLALDRHGVRYVLVGALAAVAHGARLDTHDVDLCPATDADNLERLAAGLRDLNARLIREPPRGMGSVDMNDSRTLHLDDPSEHHLFSTPFGRLDVLPAPFGPGGWGEAVTHDDLRPRAVSVRAFGLSVRVAPIADIIAAKRALGRPQDRAAESELRRLAGVLARGEQPDYNLERFAARAQNG